MFKASDVVSIVSCFSILVFPMTYTVIVGFFSAVCKVIGAVLSCNVIEDCCLAHGAEFEGKKVGSFGIGGFFSFHPIKLINTFGGGMITTDDDKIADYIREKVKKHPHRENTPLTRDC